MTDRRNGVGRRGFLQGAATLGAGAVAGVGFEALGARTAGATPDSQLRRRSRCAGDYGPLYKTKDRTTGEYLLKLPRGFEYLTYGRFGDVMNDGIATPPLHDGMAAFARRAQREAGPQPRDAAGRPGFRLGHDLRPDGPGRHDDSRLRPSSSRLHRRTRQPGRHRAQLRGRPDALGVMALLRGDDDHQRRHTARLRVRSARHRPSDGQPLKGLGRFSHEAVCVDPRTSIVYLTEDATPSGLYRFVPKRKGDLRAGGQLQMLKIGDGPLQTYTDPTGTDYGKVTWVDIDQPDPGPGEATTVQQGIAAGARASLGARGSGTATAASMSSPPAVAQWARARYSSSTQERASADPLRQPRHQHPQPP